MVLLRDHGPRVANVRLTLHTLRSYMDDSGYTFVGQATLATAACLSKPTVRKMLNVAWRAQWIGVSSQGRAGQAWRHYEYRACIPDRLDVPEIHEALVATWGSQQGEVNTDSHPDIAKVGKRLSHVNGLKTVPKGPENTKGGKTDASKVGKSTHEGGKNAVHKVGNRLSPKSSSAEVLNKLSSEEGAALPRSTTVGTRLKTTVKNPEPQAAEAKAAADKAAIAARDRKAGEERLDRVKNALKGWPDYTNAELAKVAGVKPEEVEQVRSQL
jgi:hypothetical protein